MNMNKKTKDLLISWAEEYNNPKYFQEDPIIFPRKFTDKYHRGEASLADIEIAAVFASHLAWGRRSMIVKNIGRAMDEMDWRPYDYIMNGEYRDENVSLHRTIKWSEFAKICYNLKSLYTQRPSIEGLSDMEIRTQVFSQKEDKRAPNKKISMLKRWLVRDDGIVDLGVWKNSDKKDLIIPLDVHVHTQATALGLTERKQKDLTTAREITDIFKDIFPDDPCKGDFALFGYGVTNGK